MKIKKKFDFRKILLMAAKIGIGGSAAYYIANALGIQFAASAGTVTLLTLQTTKWDTFRLSGRRILTFFMTYAVCWALNAVLGENTWFSYGIYLFLLVGFCEAMGWRNAISVNAVIGSHFLSTHNFALDFMIDEFLIVIIGIVLAIVLNLFHINSTHELEIIKEMRYAEERMKKILRDMAGYLRSESDVKNVWKDIADLRTDLGEYIESANEYQDNTFVSHPEYYINYFEMRKTQCLVLANLHSEMNRLRCVPVQADKVADYIDDLSEHVTEMNNPEREINKLEKLLTEINEMPLPQTREEFQSRAMLYHVMMDIQDFLKLKAKFIESIDERQFRIYWRKEVTKEEK